MRLSEDNTMVNIGKFSAAVGLKGEVRVNLYAKDSENLNEGTVLYADTQAGVRTFNVLSVRLQKGKQVIRMAEVASREEADVLRGLEIYINEEDLAELPEGEYYFRELIGMEVYDRASEAGIGKLSYIIDGPAQNIYAVERDSGKEVLIPAVDAFVKDIDPDAGIITVELIPGFLDL